MGELLIVLLMITGFITYKMSAAILNYLMDKVAQLFISALFLFSFVGMLL